MQARQRDGGSPDNSWLERSTPGRNPTASLQRAPFHTLAIRLLLALLTGVFIVEEKFTGVGGQRGQSVRWGWREWAFQTLTSPKIVFYATKNQVSLVYTTKCLTLSKSMSKLKTQRSLHWMFILFTRLVPPPPISKQCKQVKHFKSYPSTPRTAFPHPARLEGHKQQAPLPGCLCAFPLELDSAKASPRAVVWVSLY